MIKHWIKRTLVLVLAGVSLFSMVACGGSEDVVIDATKTLLRVHTYNGGVGMEWLKKIAAQFEQDYSEYEFEPGTGKKGVQVLREGSKQDVLPSMSASNYAIYFAESVNYSSLVSQNKLLNITDIVTTPLNNIVDTTETKTIESKFISGQKETLSFSNNTYYAVPHYSFTSSITYNKQLFIDNDLYFADGVTSASDVKDWFISRSKPTKSCGPDGVLGNDDDGLPATWEEFLTLCDYMCSKNITPFIWTGQYGHYFNHLLNAIYLNLSGKKQAELNFNYNSNGETIEIVSGFNGDEPIISNVAISESNYNDLKKQYTKYQALEFGQKIYQNTGYRSKDAVNGGISMLDAQQNYIYSLNDSDVQPIAFLIEGSYWYNESNEAGYFENAKLDYGVKFEQKNDFQVMPLPRVYKGISENLKTTTVNKMAIADCADSFAFINANIKDNANLVALAKKFLAYCYTDKALEEFTVLTGVPKNLNYDVDESKLANNYAKSVWDLYKTSDRVATASANPIYLNARMNWSFIISSNVWVSNGSGAGLLKTQSLKDFFTNM